MDSAVRIVRKFAATPVIAMELAKLKSAGLSQSVFSVTAEVKAQQPATQMCKLFSRTGQCRFGAKCKFMHTPTPANANTQQQRGANRQCNFCKRVGHLEATCHFKERLLKQLQAQPAQTHTTLSAASPAMEAASAVDLPQFLSNLNSEEDDKQATQYHFVMSARNAVAATSSAASSRKTGWVMDSGASCCATYAESDCIEVSNCNISVTAAGECFRVTRTGTAVIDTVDEQGRTVQLKMQNTLISERFPYKLLALQPFTARGYRISIDDTQLRIVKEVERSAFVGMKDSATRLFFLKQPAPVVLLARSYTDDTNLLWQLHLRHGHRNFADIARQYKLKLPQSLPACTSCIMGKSHVHPHLSTGFERATRVAEGFHSDFRGPFSVPTDKGEAYLLTLVDDYSRRIFGFLAKSQSEWMEIWTQFVTRVEAELGKTNCISWILSDNGAVYTSKAMQAFCASKGIQQRFSAPYAQWMDHTAERNMRTIGEMTTTTMLHAHLPKRCWGWATLHAVTVINRTVDNAKTNKQTDAPRTFSRLEKWKGHAIPGQTKGLYPFGCLAFKHVPSKIRGKLDAHAIPSVYLGLDPNCRAYLLGSLYRLDLSTSVEATFIENVFPFRKIKHQESPAALMWGTDNNLLEGDPRLGMFDDKVDTSGVLKALDKEALAAIGALPDASETKPELRPSTTCAVATGDARL